jgi:hypothetical protein
MVQTRERIQAVVNSARRLNSNIGETSTDFTYQFNRSFSRITEILIQSIQFPFTFYAINAANNQLRINRGTTKTVLIPPGNYTATSMIAMLNVALNNVTDPTTGYPYNGFTGETFLVTYLSTTMKFTITNGNPFTIYSSSSDALSTIASNLGFLVSSSTNVTSATADSVANLAGPKYIRIESQFLSAPTQYKPLYADNSYSTTLFILPVNAGFGSFVSTDIQIPIRLTYKFMIKNTDVIDFTVVDENGNLLDLNGQDWSMYIVMVTE